MITIAINVHTKSKKYHSIWGEIFFLVTQPSKTFKNIQYA